LQLKKKYFLTCMSFAYTGGQKSSVDRYISFPTLSWFAVATGQADLED
jgi:hypothetical protein